MKKPKLVPLINLHDTLTEAIESGVEYGWRRAHKHEDNPDWDTIKDQLVSNVIDAIYTRFETEGE